VFVCVVSFNQIVLVAKLGYINSADAHYHQVLRIAAPYFNQLEREQIESDFALVASRDDYVRLLARLENQCKAQGRTVPPFDPW
jgi:hypothetical protein